MMVSVDENILNTITQRIVDAIHPEKIILFGSHARGDQHSRSDLDLLIICPLKDGRRRMMADLYERLWDVGIAKDIIILSPEEYEKNKDIPGTISRPAWNEGKVIYEQ